jgi:uncharacterized membrane protein YccF (DUF307 family)
VCSGFWLAVLSAFAGVVRCVTVIGIPFGLQPSPMILVPFGKVSVPRSAV